MGGLSTRATRILQGGLPLPILLHDILSYMAENNRYATAATLVEIAKKRLEILHKERVLAYWGSWQAMITDLMEEMGSRELVAREGDIWVLTDRVQPGKRVRPMTSIRFTVYTEASRERREALAYARNWASSYRAFLEEKGLYAGKVQKSFEAHWNTLAWEEETEARPARKYGEVAEFAKDYLLSHRGEWRTAKEATEAFNGRHPDRMQVRSSSMWNRLQQLVWNGQAERRDGVSPGPGRNHTEFRWKDEQQ